MKFQVNDGEKFQKVMEVTVPVEELEQPIRLACKRIANSVNIPGFRKGKAPRAILESFVGMDGILNEMMEDLLPKAYSEGLLETGLEPVAQPDVEVVTLEDKKPVVFKFIITVKPEVKLGQYKDLEVVRHIIDVDDADVDQELENQRQRMTKQVDAPEGAEAKDGDTVTIDFKGMKDGVAFEGGTAENYPLTLGSGSFIPGFEEQLIGVKVGDEKNIEIKFPDDYAAEELAGTPVIFEIKVHEIKNKVLPELNQEFVEEVSETAANLDELKAEIKKNLEDASIKRAEDFAKNTALMMTIKNSELEVPPVMVDQQIDIIVQDNIRQMQSRGFAFEQYLEYVGKTKEDFREEQREQAELIVKRELIVDALIKAENIEVSEEEIDKEIEKMVDENWRSKEQIQAMLAVGDRMEDFKYDLKSQKAVELLLELASVSDEHVTKEEIARQQAEKMAEQMKADQEEKEKYEQEHNHSCDCGCEDDKADKAE